MSFDPNQFLSTQYTDATSTEYINVPEGDYIAVIGKVDIRTATIQNEERAVLDVNWEIDDQQVAELTGRSKNSVRQSIFLDLTPENNLDMGKGRNVPLGKLREALKQNRPGQPWGFGMLTGNAARVTVKHQMNGDKVYVNVTSVVGLY